MSFFCFLSKIKKLMNSSLFLWGFAFLLALSCLMIRKVELMVHSDDNIYTYQLILDNKESNVKAVDAEVNSLLNLNAKYALLMDATNRRVLFEKDGYKQVPMASTTKIMTLLVTLENANMNDIVTVSAYAASMPDVQLNIKAGEQYRLGDLLYSLMLESHNDTAVAIAEHIGGSVEDFANMMNEKAKELGANHTNFVTPNGLDHEKHYTTAYDLALISSYAIENKDFLKIIQTQTYSFHEQTTGRTFTVNNKDRFLTSYEGAIGIKTGFTGNAGYCFVGAVKREHKKFVSVVLASGWPPNKSYKWKDTTQLMNYGVEKYNLKEILKANTSFQQIPINNSINLEPITPYNQDTISLLLREDEKVSFDVELPSVLYAPVKQNQTIGRLIIKINDEIYRIVPLYSKEMRKKITYDYVLKKIFLKYLGWDNV